MGDLEQLNESNVRLKNKQASLNYAMQRHFAGKVDFERATAEFERMENETRTVLERKIAAGEDVRRKVLKMLLMPSSKVSNWLSTMPQNLNGKPTVPLVRFIL